MVNKKFWAATFTLSGTMIGAGILGLPYVFGKAGFFVGIFWLLFLGAIMIFVNLCLEEIVLRTKGKHQLTGLAEKYLGKTGGKIMFFAVNFGIYAALLAYLVGEGESLSQILPWNLSPILCGFIFWALLTIFLSGGMKSLKKIETYGVLIIIVLVLGLFIFSIHKVDVSNLLTINKSNFFLPIGVVLFSLLGFVSIPEIRSELAGSEKLMKKAIIFGSIIPIALYVLFALIFVGIIGGDIPEVATLYFGGIVTILGIFTMLSVYLVLSISLRNTFKYDLKFSNGVNFILSSLLPLFLYFIIEEFGLVSFGKIIGIGGVISAGLTGIMILIVNYKSKKTKERKPELKMPINPFLIFILSLIFIAGIVIELLK